VVADTVSHFKFISTQRTDLIKKDEKGRVMGNPLLKGKSSQRLQFLI
jgi:hypothetical protein